MPKLPSKTHFLRPDYETACFAHLPQTITHLLTGQGVNAYPLPEGTWVRPLPAETFAPFAQRYDTLIFFFIDAFGWRFFEQYANTHPFLQSLVKHGQVLKMTAQFPSTTAAHVTCIHSGLSAGQSGIYDWQYYEPKMDALFAPLLFSYAGDKRRDALEAEGVDPKPLYPSQTIYQTLHANGIKSYLLQHREYTPSVYTDHISQGATLIPYRTLPEALTNLQTLLERQQAPRYYFLYFDKIDGISHEYGPTSPQLQAEIDTLLTTLDRLFLQQIQGKRKNTLFMLTADHGQVEVNPETTIYLNQASRFTGLEAYFKRNRKGDLLVPAGAARDLFLHINPGYIEEAQDFLNRRLMGQAEVCQTRDLIDAGYFGPLPVSPLLRERIGDLVILPYAGETVWWYERDKFEMFFYGHHGGLTKEEMEIPLLVMDCG